MWIGFQAALKYTAKITASSFLRRQESKSNEYNIYFKLDFLNFNLDSHLRGNDEDFIFCHQIKICLNTYYIYQFTNQ